MKKSLKLIIAIIAAGFAFGLTSCADTDVTVRSREVYYYDDYPRYYQPYSPYYRPYYYGYPSNRIIIRSHWQHHHH
jgi:hypothetical protein